MITKEQKRELIKEYGGSENNAGAPEAQIAILTARIKDLTRHLQTHRKDNHTRRGLIKMVSKRRKLLNYLIKTDIERYRSVIKKLGLRK